MRQVIKLTESDLHRIVKEAVNKILEAHGEPDSRTAIMYDGIIEDYKANEIAEEQGITEEEAAAEWFKGVVDEMDFDEKEIPSHRQYVMDIPELDAELYHDYGAGYYFLVKNDNKQDMPGFEGTWDSLNNLTNFFNESTIKEDAGGGAANCASVMQTGSGNAALGTNPESGQYTVPFGKVQRRKIYQPKEKAGGDVTKQKSNVDMTPAMKRKNGKGGSISIPKSKV